MLCGGVGASHFGAWRVRGRGHAAEIVLFTSNVWLQLIELGAAAAAQIGSVIDLSSDGERQHD